MLREVMDHVIGSRLLLSCCFLAALLSIQFLSCTRMSAFYVMLALLHKHPLLLYKDQKDRVAKFIHTLVNEYKILKSNSKMNQQPVE